MALPPASDAFKKLDHMLGSQIDHRLLSFVLEQDLEPSQLTHEQGLLSRVAPQLMNMLARGQSWEAVLGAAAGPAKGAAILRDTAPAASRGLDDSDEEEDEEGWEEVVPAGAPTEEQLWKFALTPKVLLTFMISRFELEQRLNLATWAKDIYPMPMVFRHPEEDGRFVADPLHMQMLLKGTVMASVPFNTKGNSTLLNKMFRCCFETSPNAVSPIHAGSVDIKLTKKVLVADYPIEPFHIMDFHSGCGGVGMLPPEHGAARDATRVAQYLLVQFPLWTKKEGFKMTKDIVMKHVKPYVKSLFQDPVLSNRGKKILFLARDADLEDSKLEMRKEQIATEFSNWEQEFDCKGTLKFETLPDLSAMGEIEANQHVGRVFDSIRSHFQGARTFTDYWDFLSVFKRACNEGLNYSNTGCQIVNLQEENYKKVKKVIDNTDFSSELEWSAVPFVMEHMELQLKKKGCLSDLLNKRKHMQFRPALEAFLQSVRQSPRNLQEWKKQLVAIADKHASELTKLNSLYLKTRRDVENAQEAIVKEMKAHGKIQTTELEKKRDDGKKTCSELTQRMDSLIITVEKLWRELVEQRIH